MRNNIKIIFSGEMLEMKSALIGGRSDDFEESPTSLYAGPLDLDEIHTSLFYVNRAVIKLLMDEFSMSMDLAEEFVTSAFTEAFTKEYNVRISGKTDMDVQKIIKSHNKNQN